MITKKNKSLYYALKTIPHISYTTSEKTLCILGFNKKSRLRWIQKKSKIHTFLLNFILSNKLAQLDLIHSLFINKKKKNRTKQGKNHIKKLPVRGQRTKTNAKTQKLYKITRTKKRIETNLKKKWTLRKSL